MNCLDDKLLEDYILGRMDGKLLLEATAHIHVCRQCAERLQKSYLRKRVLSSFATQLAGLEDCPDYDTLSALVDGKLSESTATRLRSHINSCQLCYRDVQRMQALRAQAEIRGSVVVSPSSSKSTMVRPIFRWKVLAVGGAALITLAGLGMIWSQRTTEIHDKPTVTAQRIETHVAPPKQETPTPNMQRQWQSPVRTESGRADQTVHATLLRDGNYRLVRANGRYVLVQNNNRSVATPLEERISRLISDKIRTGKIQGSQPIRVALNAVRLRASGTYVPMPTAPKPLYPVGIGVIETRPTFSWSNVDLAESYRLVVTTEDAIPVCDVTTTNTKFKPEKALQRGRIYLWRVGARFGEADSWSNSAANAFCVLSESEVSLVLATKRAMPGSHLALAVVYESLGLYSDAAKEYRIVRLQNPNSPIAHKLAIR